MNNIIDAGEHYITIDQVDEKINDLDLSADMCDEPDLYPTFDPDDAADYRQQRDEWQAFRDEMAGYRADSAIHEDAFTDYAREMADDIGVKMDQWPVTCIDWDAAADELKQDYTEAEIDGHTYFFLAG